MATTILLGNHTSCMSLWQKMLNKFGSGSTKECCYRDDSLESARYEKPAKRFACYCEKCAGHRLKRWYD